MKNLESKVIQAVRLARSDFFIIIMPSVYIKIRVQAA